MGISGSQLAPLYALFGTMRFGATRFGYHSPKVFVSVGGEERAFAKATAGHKLDDLVITETTSGSPNTATFEAGGGWEPAMGDEVIVRLGSTNNTRRLYAGTVLSVGERSIGTPDYRKVTANCVDWTWLLDVGSAKVLGHFTGSATTIALAIMADAPAGFTTTLVETGLPTVDGGITFTNVDRSVALARLAKRIGATQRIDYNKDLYFRVTPIATVTPPATLVVGLDSLKAVTSVRRDLSQVFTRVPMEGGGANAACDVPAGETILPLTDAPAWWYGDFGGEVISGPQVISYTGRQAGGGGSLVGPGFAPTSAPVLALTSGAGVTAGSHDVAVVFVTAAGKSLPGPTATIVAGVVAAPATAPTAGLAQSGAGPNDGAHYYAITEVTAAGETLPSPVSNTVTTSTVAGYTVAAPATGPSVSRAAYGSHATGCSVGDTVWYVRTYRTASGGETTASPVGNSVVIELAISDDPKPFVYTVNYGYFQPGAATIRVYRYRNGSCDGYRTYTSGGQFDDAGLTWTAGTPPGSNTATVPAAYTQQIPLTDLAPASALGTSRNLYGTAAGGSQLKLVAALNTTDSTYSVTTPDASLGANAPTSNTAAASQITASAPLGPSTVTSREFYMSLAGGGARKLALTIANNTAITGTITASDATLTAAAAEPSSDTSGLSQPSGQVLPGATSIPVAGLGGADGFQAAGGYAVVGNGQHVVRYTGISGNTLTGIPATGDGSIGATIAYNSQITAAPALIGVGDTTISEQTSTGVDAKFLGVTDGMVRLGALIAVPFTATIASLTLKLSTDGSPSGQIWVTIQTGSIGPAGVVLATSDLVDISTVSASPAVVAFTLPAVPLPAGSAYIVLHGNHSTGDILWNWHNVGGARLLYNYDGVTVVNNSSIGAFWHDLRTTARPLVYPLKKGDPVNLWVTVDDTAAQAGLSALLDPDDLQSGAAGIRVAPPLQDRRKSRDECLAQATAWLSLRSTPNVTLGYRSKDMNTVAGAIVTANLAPPTNVNAELKAQSVTISNFTPSLPPDYVVQASDELYTLETLLGGES